MVEDVVSESVGVVVLCIPADSRGVVSSTMHYQRLGGPVCERLVCDNLSRNE